MFFDADLRSGRLPAKTLCLTYDDGPGPQTPDLADFLHRLGVRAAFFVVGQHACTRRDTLRRLARGGHLIGNHTWSHPGLVKLAREEGDVVSELARTAEVVRPFACDGPILFRPPYGSWRERPGGPGTPEKRTSIVRKILERASLPPHVGPVGWDIVAEDWECWRQGLSVEETCRRHLEEIERVGRGIVLLHDSSEDPTQAARNRAGELTRHLVPALLERGYRFLRVDEAPQVAAAMARGRGRNARRPDSSAKAP
jgi:peptidoglycan/xylan/chitin deacetylase (PgdA/CDA1 family)